MFAFRPDFRLQSRRSSTFLSFFTKSGKAELEIPFGGHFSNVLALLPSGRKSLSECSRQIMSAGPAPPSTPLHFSSWIPVWAKPRGLTLAAVSGLRNAKHYLGEAAEHDSQLIRVWKKRKEEKRLGAGMKEEWEDGTQSWKNITVLWFQPWNVLLCISLASAIWFLDVCWFLSWN